MQKLSTFGFATLALVLTACGSDVNNTYYTLQSQGGADTSTSAAPVNLGAAGSAGAGVTTASNGGQEVVGTVQSTCTVVKNEVIGDGYSPQVATNDQGYAVLWYDASGLPMFRTYTWDGAPASPTTVLLNANGIVGGKDDYLIAFRTETGMDTMWQLTIYGSDGMLKQNTGYYEYNNTPFLSFDGTYYRVTRLYSGCEGSLGGTGLATGRIGVDGNYYGDQGACIGPNANFSGVNGVVEQENGKNPMVALWDAGQGQSEIGAGMFIVDYARNGIWRPLVNGTGDQIGRGYNLVSSARGPLLEWYETTAAGYFVSVVQDDRLSETYKLPKGMMPSVVDGDAIVDIMRDDLSGKDSLIRASLDGVELARQEIPSPAIKARCFRDLYGRNGNYVNAGSPCLPAPAGDPVQVFVRLIQCK